MKVSTLGPIVLALIALPQSLTAQFNKPITEREFPFGGLHREVFKITYPNMNWVSTTGIPNPDGTITFITEYPELKESKIFTDSEEFSILESMNEKVNDELNPLLDPKASTPWTALELKEILETLSVHPNAEAQHSSYTFEKGDLQPGYSLVTNWYGLMSEGYKYHSLSYERNSFSERLINFKSRFDAQPKISDDGFTETYQIDDYNNLTVIYSSKNRNIEDAIQFKMVAVYSHITSNEEGVKQITYNIITKSKYDDSIASNIKYLTPLEYKKKGSEKIVFDTKYKCFAIGEYYSSAPELSSLPTIYRLFISSPIFSQISVDKEWYEENCITDLSQDDSNKFPTVTLKSIGLEMDLDSDGFKDLSFGLDFGSNNEEPLTIDYLSNRKNLGDKTDASSSNSIDYDSYPMLSYDKSSINSIFKSLKSSSLVPGAPQAFLKLLLEPSANDPKLNNLEFIDAISVKDIYLSRAVSSRITLSFEDLDQYLKGKVFSENIVYEKAVSVGYVTRASEGGDLVNLPREISFSTRAIVP